jgi:hypothetical protein
MKQLAQDRPFRSACEELLDFGSASRGILALLTDNAAVAQVKRTASSGVCPSARATAKPPLDVSPAPVVSTTVSTGNADTWIDSPAVINCTLFAKGDEGNPGTAFQKGVCSSVGLL